MGKQVLVAQFVEKWSQIWVAEDHNTEKDPGCESELFKSPRTVVRIGGQW
ncbi:hypothetical protein BDZ89DRAFT_1137685 [Hymenopellis radicata]|nr:hypothetical protein BDZ89DRAFT_1137685 [Hymenopellis radicata]